VRIHPDFPAAHLAFVGDGSLEGELRRAVATAGLAHRVHFMGFRADIPEWLAAATVWLLPTETENFSLGVLEALAAGCPIVSTLCPGNDEVLVPGYNALIHPIGDVDALAHSLRRLLSNAGLRARLAGNARTTAQGFRLECMVERYHACYEEGLVAGPGSGNGNGVGNGNDLGIDDVSGTDTDTDNASGHANDRGIGSDNDTDHERTVWTPII
jgi:glycosyltransferase involved in cell wall biosynthesis